MLNSTFQTTRIIRQTPNDYRGIPDESQCIIYVRADFREEIMRARRHISRVLREGIAAGRYTVKRGKVTRYHHGTWQDYGMRFTVSFAV